MFIIKHLNKVSRSISSPFLTSILLLTSIFLLICGTIIQIRFGISNAEKLIFSSWFFWAAPFLPLPGFKTISLLFCLNLITRFIKSNHFSFGPFFIHLSILLIIISALISYNSKKVSVLSIEEGQTVNMCSNETRVRSGNAISIPAQLHLDKFSIEKWPGSNTVKDYKSEIRISAPDGDCKTVISMNKPFQYHDCTFYQSSYSQQNGKNISIFYVVQSSTRVIPYICTAIFIIGVLFTLISFTKKSSTQKKCVLTLFIFSLLLLTPRNTQAKTTQPEFNMSEFGKLLIVNEGRYQPLESFARFKIYQYSKKCSIDNASATPWLAELLFTPERNISEKEINSLFPPVITSDSFSLFIFTGLITEMTHSYRNQDPLSFNKSVHTLLLWEKSILKTPVFYKCLLENFYTKFRFIPAVETCLLLAVLAFVVGFAGFRIKDIIPLMSITGFVLLTFFLMLRTVILERPPVVSMYETFITVSWLGSLSGILLWIKHSDKSFLFVSSIASLLFIYLAGCFGNEFSTMNAVPAVLNNNFWLTTHIFTIIAGYTAFIVLSLLGHLYLIQEHTTIRILKEIQPSTLYHLAAVALILTAAGTALGGLWANMSWGRFWGWDPKENGALLLLLWGTLITHGYKHRIISADGLAWGSAVCTILVMCTWIGVNLLGKGMHAYGFTSEGKAVLVGFTICELIFMLVIFSLRFVRPENQRIVNDNRTNTNET